MKDSYCIKDTDAAWKSQISLRCGRDMGPTIEPPNARMMGLEAQHPQHRLEGVAVHHHDYLRPWFGVSIVRLTEMAGSSSRSWVWCKIIREEACSNNVYSDPEVDSVLGIAAK